MTASRSTQDVLSTGRSSQYDSFSPLRHYEALRNPLVYFFSNYQPGGKYGLTFDTDETKTNLLITSVDNYYEVKADVKPRVLISRGSYSYTQLGIDNSLAESQGPYANAGLNNSMKMVTLAGTSTIKIQARNQGTCDLLTDIVSHFYAWTGPLLCATYGYLTFAKNMEVSDLDPVEGSGTGDSPTLFQVSVSLPWSREERYNYGQVGVKLKSCFVTQNGQTEFLQEQPYGQTS